ncbi:hypothetical protein AN216_10640 [Streptomyces oceani]|uniref:Uncharacterized protein n=1 Tax=Streptomyces oceani TaxID=1075402 RepID=A0A1E7KIB0_9ACTN|nr:hypothetical protein AN216_10640 [Streptomyces oceani]
MVNSQLVNLSTGLFRLLKTAAMLVDGKLQPGFRFGWGIAGRFRRHHGFGHGWEGGSLELLECRGGLSVRAGQLLHLAHRLAMLVGQLLLCRVRLLVRRSRTVGLVRRRQRTAPLQATRVQHLEPLDHPTRLG